MYNPGEYLQDNKVTKTHTFSLRLLHTINTAITSDFHFDFTQGLLADSASFYHEVLLFSNLHATHSQNNWGLVRPATQVHIVSHRASWPSTWCAPCWPVCKHKPCLYKRTEGWEARLPRSRRALRWARCNVTSNRCVTQAEIKTAVQRGAAHTIRCGWDETRQGSASAAPSFLSRKGQACL